MLSDEFAGWVLGNGELNNFPRLVADDKEDVKALPEHGVDGEKIHGEEGINLGGEEGLPCRGLSDLPFAPELFQGVPDGFNVEGDGELEEFALDFLRSEEGVVVFNVEDEVLDLSGNGRSAGPFPWFERPESFDNSPLPREKGFRCNDDDVAFDRMDRV